MDKSIVPVNHLAVRSSTCYEFTNSNPAEVVEIEDDDTSVENVERQLEDLKLSHQFNEKDVPQIFKTLINDQINGIKEIWLSIYGSTCLLKFDDSDVRFEKMSDKGTILYEEFNTTIETSDLEKSIVDHLWFVLKNPNIKLETFRSICDIRQELDSKKLNTLLQSMINSIDHQIQTESLGCVRFDEDTLFSMLKRVKPGTLKCIATEISWNEEGNYQKMDEIVETDQWKQAKTIYSCGVTPLTVDNLFHCERSWLELDSLTPEDVLRVVEHAFNSSSRKFCGLSCAHEKYDIDAIIAFLRSQNDGSQIIEAKPTDHHDFEFTYKIMKCGKSVLLGGEENYIAIRNY